MELGFMFRFETSFCQLSAPPLSIYTQQFSTCRKKVKYFTDMPFIL